MRLIRPGIQIGKMAFVMTQTSHMPMLMAIAEMMK
jgi:hypothetical protein